MARRVRIRRVVDGDSLEVEYVGKRQPFRVRLYGIDAPELDQPHGREARNRLAQLVRGGGVSMETKSTDHYGRTVGVLYAGSGRKRESVNAEMVRSGMAWWYRQYGGRELGLPAAEAEAKSRRRGVWQNPRAERPWDYRAKQRQAPAKRRARWWRWVLAWTVAILGLLFLFGG